MTRDEATNHIDKIFNTAMNASKTGKAPEKSDLLTCVMAGFYLLGGTIDAVLETRDNSRTTVDK